MATTPKLVGPSDPALLKSFETQTPSVARTSPPTVSATGTATSTGSTVSRSIAPTVAGETTTYTQATQASSGTELFIVSSNNNDSNDIVTVYNTQKEISVSAVNQTINNYKVTNTNTYGDSNVVTLLSAFGSNTISTTGLITGNGGGLSNVPYANVTGTPTLGNIATTNYDGNASNVLHGDGTWSADQTTYGNSNVVTLLSAFGSNTITTTGNISVGNITATNIGNIANINLTGSNSNVLYGNGVFAPASGSANTGNWAFVDNTIYNMAGGEINNGDPTHGATAGLILPNNGNAGAVTSLFNTYGNIGIAVANLANTANTSVWSFGVDGNLTLPANTFAVNYANGTAVTIPTVGNIATLNLDGNASNVLRGDGTFGADANSSYGDSNVVTLLNAFGSNTITTTGDVSVGNITATNLGNISNINLDGNVSNLLTGSGTYVAIPVVPTVGNIATINLDGNSQTWLAGNGVFANIAIPSVGNIATLNLDGNVSNLLTGNGTYVAIPVVPTVGNIATLNLDGNVSNLLTGNGTYVAIPVVPTVGNIATLNLDGSNSNVLYGNGVFAAVAGGNANTGNVTFNDINVIGTGNLKLQPASANASAYLDIYLTGGPDIHIAGNGETVILGTDDYANVAVNVNGNVSIQANAGTPQTWNFGTDGNLTLPLGSTINNVPDIVTVTLDQFTDGGYPGTQVFNKVSDTLYELSPGGPYMTLISAVWYLKISVSTYYSSTDLITWSTVAGGLPAPIGSPTAVATMNLEVGGNVWTFDAEGGLTLPIGVSIDYNGNVQYPTIMADSGKLFSVQGQGNTGSAALAWTVDPNAASQYAAVAVSRAGDNLAKVVLQAQSDSGNVGTVKLWNFDETGNLTLPGNTFAVNYANGTQVSISGGGNTGNVTFDDNIVIGTGDEFGGGGLYLAVGPDSIANGTVQYLRVRGGDAPTHIHLDTGNNQAYDQYFGDDTKYVKLELGEAGNIVVGTDDANGNLYSWSFTSDGNLILAGGNSVIQSIANSSLDTLNPNVSTMVLTPDPGYGSQALVLDPTASGHIHLRAYAFSNIDDPAANIFLGGEDTAFEVTSGANNQAVIHSNGKAWTFGNDGNISSDTLTFTTTFANVKTVEYQTAGVWDLYVEDGITGSNTAASRLNVSFKDNLIDKPQVYIENTKESDGIALRWTFDENGNLNLPGNLVIAGNTSVFGTDSALIQTTDNLPLIALSSGANGAVSSLWVEDIGNVGTSNIAAVYANPTSGSKIVRIAVGQNGNAGPNLWDFNANGTLTFPGTPRIDTSTNNFEVQAAEAINFEANTVVNIYTDTGNNAFQWQFGDDGNLTLPDTTSVLANVNITLEANDTGNITGLNLIGDSNANLYAHGNVKIVSDSSNTTATWTFGADGNLTIPGTSGGFIKTASNASIGVAAVDNGTNNPAQLLSINAGSGAATSIVSAYATNATIQTNATGAINTWKFDNAGNLTLPANAFAINYANGTQVSLGGGNVTWAQIDDKAGNSGPTIITLGQNAGFDGQGNAAIAIGKNAGAGGQGASSITIGEDAGGNITQGANSVAIGRSAGFDGQGIGAVAIGSGAGSNTQGNQSVAIGENAGVIQGSTAVAIGQNAGGGVALQGDDAVAIGHGAGSNAQGTQSVAIGLYAGQTTQGVNAIAIGANAGITSQGNNSIILNATGANLNQTTANTFTVAPVRNDTSNIAEVMFYNTTSKEVTYGNTISVAGNITGAYILGNGSQLTSLPAPTVTPDISSNGDMSIMTYDGVIKSVNYATVEPSSGNIKGGNISTTGIVTANTANITTGNITTINSGLLQNGNSNITLTANGNVSIQAAGSTVELVVTSTGANITGTANITGNANVANIGATDGVFTGNISGNTNGFTIGYLNIPQVAAANATLALGDAGKHYYSTTAGNFTLTVPLNSSVAFATGTAVSIVVQAAGNILVNAASGVTLYMAGNSTAANRAVGGYGMATLMKVGTDTWFINGTGVA